IKPPRLWADSFRLADWGTRGGAGCVTPTGPLSRLAACAKILGRSPADGGAGDDVGNVLSRPRQGRRQGECTSSWILPRFRRDLGRARRSIEKRSPTGDSVQTDSMIVRQSDHPVKDYFFRSDPFSEGRRERE